ncbi:MAG: AAA family ATPase [Planctomycetes bacterium]|nr:AAA family ATPase [Planctomycetota bacterium]
MHLGVLAPAARAYQAAGLCVLPARMPEKRPAVGTWKDYQSRLPTAAEVEAWFANSHPACCLICGAVSGNLELIDFDCAGEAFTAWSTLVNAEVPGLLDRLVVETSPSGGWHVVYRCTEPVCGNLKLAQRREDLDSPAEVMRFGKSYKPRKDRDGRWHIVLTMIETRGEGGLFLCAPSTGYQLMQGEFTALPVLTAAERDVLLRCAWAINAILPEPVDPQPGVVVDGERPGDDFNRRADFGALLQHHGWSLAHDGANQHWCRPGKMNSTSATLKDGVLYVFSSNAAPFEPSRAYSPFAAYALLEHHGDFQAAATELRRSGYGAAPQPVGDVDLSGLLPAATAPLLTFDLQTFAETPEREIAWLWPGVMPRGMLSLIGGKQGLGKSFLICDLAARVSAGQSMPDGTIHPPGKVLLLAREDDASCVLLPRLRAAKADLSRVCWSVFANTATGSPIDLAAHVHLLVEATTARAFDLIVVDTFAAFAPAGTDANAAQDVRLLLDALTRLARQTGAAVVVVAHLRKTGQGDGDPMDAIAGSAQMTAGVRVATMLDKGMQDGERWFRVVKSNLGKIDENGWTWRFHWPDPFTDGASDVPRIVWAVAGEDYASLDANRQAGTPTVDPSAIQEALAEVLAKGPRSLRAACDLVVATVRKANPRLRKGDVELAIDGLIEDRDGGVEAWEGPRGMRMVGLPGSQVESPEDKALRLAHENPDLSVRELMALAGCRTTTASEALRMAKSATGKANA